MKRTRLKRIIVILFALTIPFLLWFVPWLAVGLSGRACDPGPPQPTWQCGVLAFSNFILPEPAFWILGFGGDHAVQPGNTATFVAELFLFDYLFWGSVVLFGYCGLRLFGSIRRRFSN